jgi:hypothetical protein
LKIRTIRALQRQAASAFKQATTENERKEAQADYDRAIDEEDRRSEKRAAGWSEEKATAALEKARARLEEPSNLRLHEAIKARLTGGRKAPWPKFCDAVRADIGAAAGVRGLSDRTIRRLIAEDKELANLAKAGSTKSK